jgi:glycerol-3-phosphate O-acyltransferase
MIRSLRGRSFGRVYIRFAEPIALRSHMARAGDDRLIVEKLAFQIANQINTQVSLTAVSLVSSALTGAGRRALTLPELEEQVHRMLEYGAEKQIPIARELEGGAKATVEAAVAALRRSKVVDVYDGGQEPVYSIKPDKHLVASFYRNTIIHFFLTAAITALARAASRERGDLQAWALRLRNLLKFEFFFSERDSFRADVEVERARLEREEAHGTGPIGAANPGILLDYLESYWVMTETLRSLPPGDTALSEKELLERAQALGRQKLLQDDVHAPELLSNQSFKNALLLAVNLGAARSVERGTLRGDARALDALADDLYFLARLARSARSDP